MRRYIIGAALAAVTLMVMRAMTGKAAPAIRTRCSEACERMLANMPASFPPNRMMADLEELKEQTARILSLLERDTGDQA